jgi:AraC-like DNA-binding protein
MDFHCHNYFQAIQVLDGQLEVDYGAGWKIIDLGSVHVLPAGCSHRLRTNTGHRQFGLNFTPKADEMGLLSTIKITFPAPAIQGMCFLKPWEEQLMEDASAVASARLRLLHVLEDWTITLIETKDRNQSNPEATRLAGLLKSWNRRPAKVGDVAKRLYCSRAKAQRICKRQFGCGIATLHEKMRMKEAVHLLLNAGLSVGDVADQCGFGDIYSFTRVFTRVMGNSPSAFRRKIKDG